MNTFMSFFVVFRILYLSTYVCSNFSSAYTIIPEQIMEHFISLNGKHNLKFPSINHIKYYTKPLVPFSLSLFIGGSGGGGGCCFCIFT